MNFMKLSCLLLAGIATCACVSLDETSDYSLAYRQGNHMSSIETIERQRQYRRVAPPPDPRRTVQVQDCTRPIVIEGPNLVCG